MGEARELLVRDIMVSSPVTVTTNTTVADASRLMRERNIGAVVVTDSGRVKGVFSERDLLRRAFEAHEDWEQLPIWRFMSDKPVTVAADVAWGEAMEIMDQRHIRHLPVIDGEGLVGMLSMRDLLHHRARYLESLVQDRTAELAARNVALTEHDRQIRQHLQIAGRIQRRLRPEKPPDFEPFRFAVAFHPHDQVAGDHYDFTTLGPDRLSVLIADVSGHGVPAAFVSVMAKTCFSAYCQGMESPAAVLQTMNDRLGDLIEAEHFITMFVASVNRRTQTLTYARAGHPLPLLFRAATRQVTGLDAPGVMIGVMPAPAFADHQIQLEPGDKVLFYTDGLAECRNVDDELFGTARLEEFWRREGHRPCVELLDALRQEVKSFRGDQEFDDDVTIIVMETGR